MLGYPVRGVRNLRTRRPLIPEGEPCSRFFLCSKSDYDGCDFSETVVEGNLEDDTGMDRCVPFGVIIGDDKRERWTNHVPVSPWLFHREALESSILYYRCREMAFSEEIGADAERLEATLAKIPEAPSYVCGKLAVGDGDGGSKITLTKKRLAIPLSPEDIENVLLPLCTRSVVASVNIEKEESDAKVNLNVRDSYELDASEWECSDARVSGFDFDEARKAVQERLLCLKNATIITPYKLLVYKEGGHFKEHVDSQYSVDVVGTITVNVPTTVRSTEGGALDGGELYVRVKGREHVLPLCSHEEEWSFGAWRSQQLHGVKRVYSGYCVRLTYLVRRADTSEPNDALEFVNMTEVAREVSQAMESLAARAQAIPYHRSYTCLFAPIMKEADKQIREAGVKAFTTWLEESPWEELHKKCDWRGGYSEHVGRELDRVVDRLESRSDPVGQQLHKAREAVQCGPRAVCILLRSMYSIKALVEPAGAAGPLLTGSDAMLYKVLREAGYAPQAAVVRKVDLFDEYSLQGTLGKHQHSDMWIGATYCVGDTVYTNEVLTPDVLVMDMANLDHELTPQLFSQECTGERIMRAYYGNGECENQLYYRHCALVFTIGANSLPSAMQALLLSYVMDGTESEPRGEEFGM